jgi:hypothetical protein
MLQIWEILQVVPITAAEAAERLAEQAVDRQADATIAVIIIQGIQAEEGGAFQYSLLMQIAPGRLPVPEVLQQFL